MNAAPIASRDCGRPTDRARSAANEPFERARADIVGPRSVTPTLYAAPIVQKMLRLYVFLLFLVPGTLLDLVGYDYGSIGGSPITKIHVSTYFLIVLAAVFLVTYPDKQALLRYYLSRRLGSLFLFAAATIALVNIIAGKRNGFGMYFDTDLHLFLYSMLLPFIAPPEMNFLERFLHIFFWVNGALAILELASGWHPLPLTTYSPDGYTSFESRATGLLMHPLHAAAITCVYILALLCGAGAWKRRWMRGAIVAFQCVALLAFGGRTAIGLIAAVLSAMYLWRLLRFFTGARQSLRSVMVMAGAPAIFVVMLMTFFAAGLLDPFIERMQEDSGSARTRLLMWPLLTSFNWGEMLWGAPTDYVFSQVVSHGLEWGVENPFMHMAVYQGLVIATMIMAGIIMTIYENYLLLERRSIVTILAFMLLCNTFGSFGGRFYTFAIFTTVVAVLFRRREGNPDDRTSAGSFGRV